MSRAFVVLNPVAGHSDAEALRQALEQRLAGEDWAYEVYRTTGEDRVGEVVRAALDREFDVFVAAGGDGTVAGVANGLAQTGTPLGIVPVGTGNTLARELDIPLDVEGALDLLVGDHAVLELDALRVEDRFFLLNMTVGISALTMRDTDHVDKRRLGVLAYLWTGLRKFVGWQPHRFNIVVDGQESRIRASEVAVANIGAIGIPTFRWGPQVRPDDGRLDVCIVRARSALDYLRVGWSLLLRQQRRDPCIRCLSATRGVSIRAGRSLPVQADGEFVGRTPVRVAVVASAVRVIVPQSRTTQVSLL
jgi:YegS/Rv2252/BmrU family lipid kinase